MKFRKDFVTNSSSSSYICEICGADASGWDMCLSEAGMVQCVNGHTICEDEMLTLDKQTIIDAILADEYCKHTLSELNEMDESDLLRCGEFRYEVTEQFCPICQFIEYSDRDLSDFLFKRYGVDRDEVFEEIKKVNKRRKKLYNSEYITYVCQRHSLNPIDIVATWKKEFNTYAAFKKYIRA